MAEAKPNLFIVGAPRCGTSAMHQYLAAHPQVFMPAIKEPHFFCADLNEERDRFGGKKKMDWPITTLEQYLWLFRGASGERRLGDSSVLYLRSRTSAREIAAFNPDARIIIMLREPVSFLHSLHSVFVYLGDEDRASFADAMAVEPERRAGRQIPPTVRVPSNLLYSEMARFTEQIERYQAAFPAEQIKIVIFDDFTRDTAAVYRDTLEFLGLDPLEVPAAEFRQRNPNKAPRSRRASLWTRALHPAVVKLYTEPTFPREPGFRPPWLARALPTRALLALHRVIEKVNSKTAPRSPLAEETRRELQRGFRDEVERLSALLDRDLVRLWGYGV